MTQKRKGNKNKDILCGKKKVNILMQKWSELIRRNNGVESPFKEQNQYSDGKKDYSSF